MQGTVTPSRRPAGYFILALLIGTETLVAVPVAAFGNEPWYARGAMMVLIALAGVSVEALWRVRPWCTRAVGALFAVLAVLLAVVPPREDLSPGELIVSLLMMAAVLAYVHHREVALFGRPGARMPLLRLPARLRRP